MKKSVNGLFGVIIVGLLSVCICGCSSSEDDDGIEQTKVSKNTTVVADKKKVVSPKINGEKSTGDSQMLAAIFPYKTGTLYFKLQGPVDQIKPLIKPFYKFVGTMKFDGTTSPWTVPTGWKQLPDNHPKNRGRFPRLATIRIGDSAKPLEISISTLGRPFNDQTVFINLIRWRRLIGLSPPTMEALYTPKDGNPKQEVRKIKINGTDVVLVSLTGKP